MGFYDDDDDINESKVIEKYVLKAKRGWFRGKNVFTDRLYMYERQLLDNDVVQLRVNVGNMIYTMMRRLEIGVDWEKQNALINSYRDLMYKLSYVNVMWYKNDIGYLSIEGEKSDVMWAISFITQVFPEEPMSCQITSEGQDIIFDVLNGDYSGASATQVQQENDVMPDIWITDVVSDNKSSVQGVVVDYNESYEPMSGEVFAIPDGRIAQYIRMDERYMYADNYGCGIDAVIKHNISASLIKDFEDLVHMQAHMDYDLYSMRYVALMNKVHDLEKKLGGLEVSCYDILPIGERGLPYASSETLDRTNKMDQGSLKYILDKIRRNKNHLTDRECKQLMQEIGLTVLYRIDSYDIEFQTYQITGSDTNLCSDIRLNYCYDLYSDFAEIESYHLFRFPASVYRALCNDPENDAAHMTAFECQRLQLFGRGYLDFLQYQVQTVNNRKWLRIYKTALNVLSKYYLN